jgi:hypothetical protein
MSIQSWEEIAFFREFKKVKRSIINPHKNKDNPHFKSKYVDLGAIVDAIDTALDSSPIDYRQFCSYVGDSMVEVVTELFIVLDANEVTSDEGAWKESHVTRLPISRLDAQSACGGFTYAKRYALTGIFGIVAEEDDDGTAASKKPDPPKKESPPPEAKPPVLFNKANAEHKDKLIKVLEREKIADSYWDAIAISLQGKPMTELKNILSKLTGAKK